MMDRICGTSSRTVIRGHNYQQTPARGDNSGTGFVFNGSLGVVLCTLLELGGIFLRSDRCVPVPGSVV